MNELPTQQMAILQALRKIGAIHVFVYMSGSGDSGDVHERYVQSADGGFIPKKSLQEPISYTWAKNERKYAFNPFSYTEELITGVSENVFLYDAINDLVDKAIIETNVDWYNNEGGSGTFTLDVITGVQTVVMTQNEQREVFNRETIYGQD